MRLITFAVAAASFAAIAGSAAAAATDVEYLQASRCKGLASGSLAPVDTAALDAYLQTEKRFRSIQVVDRGQDAMDRAKREAKTNNEQRKARLTAELNGPCQAFKG